MQEAEIGDDFAQHLGGDDEHEDCENPLELWHGQCVGGFGAQRGEGDGADDDTAKGGEVDIAEAIRRAIRGVQPDPNKPRRADERDERAYRSGGGDGAVDGDVADGHEGDVLHPAAHAHECGEAGVERGAQRKPRLARHALENVGFVGAQDHIAAEEKLACGEDEFEVLGVEYIGQPCSPDYADNHPGDKGFEHRDIDCGFFVVRKAR